MEEARGNQQFTAASPQAARTYFEKLPEQYTVEDLLDASSAGTTTTHSQSDPQYSSSSGGTEDYYSTADGGSTEVVAAAAQRQPVLYPLGLGQAGPAPAPAPAPAPTGATGAGSSGDDEEMLQAGAGSALLGSNFNTQEVDATPAPSSSSSSAVEDHIPLPPVVNPVLAPDYLMTSMLQSMWMDGIVHSIMYAPGIKPPDGSTDSEIIRFLEKTKDSIPRTELNVSLGKQDQIAPKAARSYVTTEEMMPNKKTYHGYWKETHAQTLGLGGFSPFFSRGDYDGLKRTFQFHKDDGTRTNWFMHEYIPMEHWGVDLFMKKLRFREVYKDPEVPVPDDPTPPKVKIKTKIAAAKKHRMRGPKDLVIEGESPAWQHFIKIYDRHPELPGSKVVYAVCRHCDAVLKAGKNGTNNLLTHCDRTCPVKNKKQQPSSSSPYSTGDSSCPSTASDTGSSSLDQDFNAEDGIIPRLGGGLAHPHPDLHSTGYSSSCASTTTSKKRKRVARGSSSQRQTPESDLVESEAGLIQSDAISSDIKPPDGSTPLQIVQFLCKEGRKVGGGEYEKVNHSLAEEDQTAPKAVRSYITTVEMMTNHETQLGYWKEKQVETVRRKESGGISSQIFGCAGLKRTFQFHTYDGTKTNWFMDEYIPTSRWGMDLYMEGLRFRAVYQGVEVRGEPKSRQVAAVKHRKREPHDMWVEGESEAWKHFIKIYDRHPELSGSKVVYAVCCHCPRVLRAATENGTNSLSTHWKRTCPINKDKSKNQQPSPT